MTATPAGIRTPTSRPCGTTRGAWRARARGGLALGSALSIAACATPMQMAPFDARATAEDEGVVVGSVVIRGGDDIMGRTRWSITAAKLDRNAIPIAGSRYTVAADRNGFEQAFVTHLPAGDYQIYKLTQAGFSSSQADIDLRFTVRPDRVTYIGRLIFEFPPGFILGLASLTMQVEDAREATLKSVAEMYGIDASQAVTDLIAFHEQRPTPTSP